MFVKFKTSSSTTAVGQFLGCRYAGGRTYMYTSAGAYSRISLSQAHEIFLDNVCDALAGGTEFYTLTDTWTFESNT